MIYFDHNATSPMLPAAREVWLEATQRYIGNPSSPHRVGDRAEKAMNDARESLANIIGCHPLEIVWTSGATEANNMVMNHLRQSRGELAAVWVSNIEHPAVLESVHHYFPKGRTLIPVEPDGTLDLERLRSGFSKRHPVAIGVMAVNNETGVLQPWREVQEMCLGTKVLSFCDATQLFGKLPAGGVGVCDFVSGSGHKFGGPRGVGFLKCPEGESVKPLLLGGSQESGRRAGTENVPGVLAMVKALGIREAAMREKGNEERFRWRDDFIDQLQKRLPEVQLVGDGADRVWNTVSCLMPQADCQQRWVVKLDKAGFAVSTGSACSSGKEQPSHVLTAMGHPSEDAGRVLRFSSGWETTREDWMALLKGIESVQQEMK